MKNTVKTADLTPGNIIYRVDVYEKNQIGNFKGYYPTFFAAEQEKEHEIFMPSLMEIVPHTQISMLTFINENDFLILDTYYFI